MVCLPVPPLPRKAVRCGLCQPGYLAAGCAGCAGAAGAPGATGVAGAEDRGGIVSVWTCGGPEAGAGAAGAGDAFSPLRTDPLPRPLRLANTASVSDVTMNTAASTAVVRVRKFEVPRGPKPVWLPM